MVDLIVAAIPMFLIFVTLEVLSFVFLPDDDERGYEVRDSATSLSMGIGNVLINVGWKLAVVAAYAGVYLLAPFHWSISNPLSWVVLFFAEDLTYYWFHRIHHEVRFFWASHVVHHSSQYFNLSTALRQTWTPMTGLPFWLPLALFGFSPAMILTQQSISLLYQFFIHTERIDRLPRPIELIWNTPSHHRVHHGSNDAYLDRNYAGILIIWDRLFGTFEPEGERVAYGLTTNIETFNPARVAFHEFADLWRDVRSAGRWRDRLGYVFGHPGWTPASR